MSSATASKRLQFFRDALSHRILRRLLVHQITIRLGDLLLIERRQREKDALPSLGLEEVMRDDADALSPFFSEQIIVSSMCDAEHVAEQIGRPLGLKSKSENLFDVA